MERRPNDRWEPGTSVVLQDVYRGRVWAARPMIVVRDDGDFVALWAPKGSIRKVPTGPPSRPRLPTRAERFVESLRRMDWVHVDNEWDVDTLWLIRDGEWSAMEVAWRDGFEFWGWYVNLQEPFRRTRHGLQTMDLELDIVIENDRTWRLKDEAEFDALVASGVIARDSADHARDEATRIIRSLELNERPFNEPWAEWRPDPGWTLPALPDGWDQP